MKNFQTGVEIFRDWFLSQDKNENKNCPHQRRKISTLVWKVFVHAGPGPLDQGLRHLSRDRMKVTSSCFGSFFFFQSHENRKTKHLHTGVNKCPDQRQIFDRSRKGMRNFQTRKEIIEVKYFHSYLVFTVTFLFWCGNCSSLSEQYSILPPKIFQHT